MENADYIKNNGKYTEISVGKTQIFNVSKISKNIKSDRK